MKEKRFLKKGLTRRDLLYQMGGIGVSSLIASGSMIPSFAAAQQARAPQTLSASMIVSADDDSFLDELEKRNAQYFWDQASPQTGLVRDRCNVTKNDNSIVASIAATGFGLTALCIAQERGYIPSADARDRVLTTLRFLWKKMPTHRGFFYHFANIDTGRENVGLGGFVCRHNDSTVRNSHLSRALHDATISDLAHAIFDRVDWTWLSEDTTLLSHGWTPELGFIPSRWDLLQRAHDDVPAGHGIAISSAATATRGLRGSGLRLSMTACAILARSRPCSYTSIRRPGLTFAASAIAMRTTSRIRSLPRMCIAAFALNSTDSSCRLYKRFVGHYRLRFSDRGYVVWGGPPDGAHRWNRSFPPRPAAHCRFFPKPPCACCATFTITFPTRGAATALWMHSIHSQSWYDTDVIGIDTGITMLMAENARTGFVWEHVHEES
jgi:hypothetical protein